MTRRRRTPKPAMPANLEPAASAAVTRHARRSVGPGVAVAVEPNGGAAYVLASPHRDTAAWEAMVCDALGTRSASTAQTFLYQLTDLCTPDWHPTEDGQGEWRPDERQLNMILHMVAGIRPKNEMEAALAAQMVAVHMMQMRVSARALSGGCSIPEDTAIAGKLARTFVMQIDSLSRLKGRRSSSKQTITVRQEKHVHNHQHVHLEGEGAGNRDQSHDGGGGSRVRAGATGQPEGRASLPSSKQGGEVVPLRRGSGKEGVPVPRRTSGGTEG